MTVIAVHNSVTHKPAQCADIMRPTLRHAKNTTAYVFIWVTINLKHLVPFYFPKLAVFILPSDIQAAPCVSAYIIFY